MADTKITGLQPPQPGYAIVPSTDVLPIVVIADPGMAASGSTRKATVNQILGAGGTATLASATITGAATVGTTLGVTGVSTLASAVVTGDLTVDTSTLKVDSANNRVGIGTASPIAGSRLDVRSAIGTGTDIQSLTVIDTSPLAINNGGGLSMGYVFEAPSTVIGRAGYIKTIKENATDGNYASAMVFGVAANGVATAERYRIGSDGTSTWSVGGSTAMTLNSTGLGVGMSPSAILSVLKSSATQATGLILRNANGTDGSSISLDFETSAGTSGIESTLAGRISGRRVSTGTTGALDFFVNSLGTLGSAKMVLDASGNLLVGKTAIGTTVGIEARPDGYFIATRSESTDVAAFTNAVYSTGASAYRFYVGMGGTVYATNTTISAISDARFKENVQDIDVGLGAILALKPRKFDWKDGKGKNIKGDRGFIAQEFEQVFPQLVDEWADPSPEGEAPYKSVRQDLIPVLVKAIQELTARVEALEA